MEATTTNLEEKTKDISTLRKLVKVSIKINVKKLGTIVYYIERFFYLLQDLPPQCFLENRIDADDLINLEEQRELTEESAKDFAEKSKTDREKVAKERAPKINTYISRWILAELILIGLSAIQVTTIVKSDATWAVINKVLLWLCLIAASLRIIDIIQTNINILVFDPIRRNHRIIFSSTRSLIYVLLNFFELMILFGILYTFCLGHLNTKDSAGDTSIASWGDAFYFSVMTQLTVGYGDITPTHGFKSIACIQAVTGFLFTVFVIVRIVNIFTPPDEVKKTA